MIETRYKDPYVLNCGHTFEKDKAQSLNFCGNCGAEIINSAPNFALRDLIQKLSERIVASSDEIEEHNFECVSDMNDGFATQNQYDEQQQEMYTLVKQTNEITKYLWLVKCNQGFGGRSRLESLCKEQLDNFDSFVEQKTPSTSNNNSKRSLRKKRRLGKRSQCIIL